jgi:hypothetical protein
MDRVITNVELTLGLEADDMRGYAGVERELFEIHASPRIGGAYCTVSQRLQGNAFQVQLSSEEFRDSQSKEGRKFLI